MASEIKTSRDSTCAVLTAPGAGAVATIDVSLRHKADQNAFAAFRSSTNIELSRIRIGRILFGSWNGEDVVVVRTGVDRWEVHCHGGAAAVSRILQDLNQAGVIICSADEHIAQSGVDPINARILKTTEQCRTTRTAGLSLAQLDGRLHRLLARLQSGDDADVAEARGTVEAWRNVAAHLTTPWKIAVVGSPNVGKSSLLNAVAGRQRSIVSSTAGTTRDLVDAEIVLDGWLFLMTDTAGVRDDADTSLERMGIEHSLQSLRESDLICIVVDVRAPVVDATLLQCLQKLSCPMCIVENKSDLLGSDAGAAEVSEVDRSIMPGLPRFRLSATQGSGLRQLLEWIVRSAVPSPPSAETTLPLPELFAENIHQC